MGDLDDPGFDGGWKTSARVDYELRLAELRKRIEHVIRKVEDVQESRSDRSSYMWLGAVAGWLREALDGR